jgi:hypothetical protein
MDGKSSSKHPSYPRDSLYGISILYIVSRKTSDEESFQSGISGTQVGES